MPVQSATASLNYHPGFYSRVYSFFFLRMSNGFYCRPGHLSLSLHFETVLTLGDKTGNGCRTPHWLEMEKKQLSGIWIVEPCRGGTLFI